MVTNASSITSIESCSPAGVRARLTAMHAIYMVAAPKYYLTAANPRELHRGVDSGACIHLAAAQRSSANAASLDTIRIARRPRGDSSASRWMTTAVVRWSGVGRTTNSACIHR